MKVLHLITALNPGGIERWILNMLANTDRNKYEMDVCCQAFHRGLWAAEAERFGAKVYLNPLTPDHVVFGLRLAVILIRGKYQVLHVHVGTYAGFPTWIARKANVKVASTLHNVKFPPHLWLFKLPMIRGIRSLYSTKSIAYNLKQSDYVTGVSHGCVDAFVPNHSSIRLKSAVIHHGVNLVPPKSQQERNQFREKLNWPEDSKIIVNVGRFNEQKNHLGVLNVFEGVSKEVPSARLVLVGDGLLRSKIQNVILNKKLNDRVALLGFRDDAIDIMGCCDVMLMPSFYEGFGIAAIEAACVGLPFVGSKVPGLVESVHHGKTGFLHGVGDDIGMACSVTRLLNDSELAFEMARNARLICEKDYSMERMCQSYYKVYNKMVGRI